MNQFMLYVSQKDSQDIYPDNNVKSFTVQLPKIIILEGKWSCCVKKVQVNTIGIMNNPLAIHCDFCQENFHYGTDQPVLIDFVLKSEGGWREYEAFNEEGYVNVKNNTLRIIRFKVIGDTSNVLSELRLQLHFKREL